MIIRRKLIEMIEIKAFSIFPVIFSMLQNSLSDSALILNYTSEIGDQISNNFFFPILEFATDMRILKFYPLQNHILLSIISFLNLTSICNFPASLILPSVSVIRHSVKQQVDVM